jgi:hypothetical protein
MRMVLQMYHIHKYAIWHTWYNGDWYGGIAYNMDFKSGTWYGGILDEIQVIKINDNSLELNGIFKFKLVMTFIISNGTSLTF